MDRGVGGSIYEILGKLNRENVLVILLCLHSEMRTSVGYNAHLAISFGIYIYIFLLFSVFLLPMDF